MGPSVSVVFTLWPRLCVKFPYYCVRSRFPTFARYSFISLFLFVLSGLPLVIPLHRLGRVVVYVATSNDPTARGYLPAKAVGWLRPAGSGRMTCVLPEYNYDRPLAT